MQITQASIEGKVREHNEDNVYTEKLEDGTVILCVADGIGGHNAGEVASGIVVATLYRNLDMLIQGATPKEYITQSIMTANKKIYNEAIKNPQYANMGTTSTIAVIKNNLMTIGHVGDSRAYILNRNKYIMLTEDDSYVNYLIKQNIITPEEAENHPKKNVITNALGMTDNIDMTLLKLEVQFGDIILLCSDGLNNHVSDEDMKETLQDIELSLEEKKEKLVQMALDDGGKDNISIILCKVTRNIL